MQRKRGSEAVWQRDGRSQADEKKKTLFARGLCDLVVTNRRRLAVKRQQKAALADGDADMTDAAAAAPRGGAGAQRAAASVTPRSLPLQLASAVAASAGGGSAGSLELEALPAQLRLQLFPVDEATLAAVTAAGWNPHLELTFKCALHMRSAACERASGLLS